MNTLDSYRWLLRVTSRANEYMDFAVQRLDLSLSHIHKLTAKDIVGHSSGQTGTPLLRATTDSQSPRPQDTSATQAGQMGAGVAGQDEQGVQLGQYDDNPEALQSHYPTSLFYEDAILESLLQSSDTQQLKPLTLLIPISPAFDAVDTTPRTLDSDYLISPQEDAGSRHLLG